MGTVMFRPASRDRFFEQARAKNPALYDRLIGLLNTGQPEECWERKVVGGDGYGAIKINGRNIKTHRIMFTFCFFDPDGLEVMHMCDNPACANPLHLRAGTHKDNMEDRTIKRRGADHRGEKNGRAKIPASDVPSIRTSNEPLSVLAKRYGVSDTAIWCIKNGRNWPHLQEAQ